MNSLVIRNASLQNLEQLRQIEEKAWSTPGENVCANPEKIKQRILTYPIGTSVAFCEKQPIGSQYAFKMQWDGNIESLKSWDFHTKEGWINQAHDPSGGTGFLVGVGVVPEFRGIRFEQGIIDNQKKYKASQMLIAFTLKNLFADQVRRVIGCARVPFYHQKSQLSIGDYCALRLPDGRLFDPVLRFHEFMGAQIVKPIKYAMEDQESLNAGCWVVYKYPFKG
ncbi:MAG: hypothetical protein WCT08_02560 [Patescibacteria group bacterium]